MLYCINHFQFRKRHVLFIMAIAFAQLNDDSNLGPVLLTNQMQLEGINAFNSIEIRISSEKIINALRKYIDGSTDQ